ncbi:Scr1 family TA system antitoxin-like transcriptional regulator [Streptomyces sp. NPDC057638]|uniref:Scr1 family TA system antitoxin-like transcriptional regulator n=1 Tax=Streptomyces sp. NPDC057638 TaxID=3346190 RepID=UPI0036AA17DA
MSTPAGPPRGMATNPSWQVTALTCVVGLALADQRIERRELPRDVMNQTGATIPFIRRVEKGHFCPVTDVFTIERLVRHYYSPTDPAGPGLLELLHTHGPFSAPREPLDDTFHGWPSRLAACERRAPALTIYSALAFPPLLQIPIYTTAWLRTCGPTNDLTYPSTRRALAPDHSKQQVQVILEQAPFYAIHQLIPRCALIAQLTHVLRMVDEGRVDIRLRPPDTAMPQDPALLTVMSPAPGFFLTAEEAYVDAQRVSHPMYTFSLSPYSPWPPFLGSIRSKALTPQDSYTALGRILHHLQPRAVSHQADRRVLGRDQSG